MARVIDADKRIEEIKKIYCDGCDNYGGCKCRACWVDDAMCLIDDATTVDAVEVVRCRECKHFRHYGKTSLFINGKNIKAGWCQRRISYDEEYRMTADDFCSYGERKDGDGNG